MQQVRACVETEFSAVNQIILKQLHSRVPLVENIGHYIIEAGGKRLRPMLVLLANGACDGQPMGRDSLDLAAVIEFLHTATLLHDDVVDVSALRRGRPTANAEYGNASSVLVGDFLYSRAFQMLVALERLEYMQVLSDTTNTIAEGEVLQLTKAGRPETDENAYLEVITNKTAVLFAAAAQCGAIAAGAGADVQKRLYDYGLYLGIAFQLIDDVLDYRGDAKTMGKNVGDDLNEGKPTLPLIETMRTGSKEDAELVRQTIVDKDGSKIEAIVAAVERSGALDYTEALACRYADRARDCLEGLPDSHYRKQMMRLSELAVRRQA